MIALVIAFLTTVIDPHTAELAAGARATAPAYLTAESAMDHATAAAVAARVYGVDAALLLSVAWHESRYATDAVTLEVGGRRSCGVMTPEPLASCPPPSMYGGYLAGARHVRVWLDAMHGDLHTALTGVAGGYHLIGFCARGGVHRGCQVADVFLERARWIRAWRSS